MSTCTQIQTLQTNSPLFYVGELLLQPVEKPRRTADTMVDCEGLRGSFNPAAHQYVDAEKVRQRQYLQKRSLRPEDKPRVLVKARDRFNDVLASSNSITRNSYAKEVEQHQRTSSNQLAIQWANVIAPPTRQHAGQGEDDDDTPRIDSESARLVVAELYPRLLYTFSDVVCYVTQNVK
jgi:hypothetical protein